MKKTWLGNKAHAIAVDVASEGLTPSHWKSEYARACNLLIRATEKLMSMQRRQLNNESDWNKFNKDELAMHTIIELILDGKLDLAERKLDQLCG